MLAQNDGSAVWGQTEGGRSLSEGYIHYFLFVSVRGTSAEDLAVTITEIKIL
jgi:hypothetical protein